MRFNCSNPAALIFFCGWIWVWCLPGMAFGAHDAVSVQAPLPIPSQCVPDNDFSDADFAAADQAEWGDMIGGGIILALITGFFGAWAMVAIFFVLALPLILGYWIVNKKIPPMFESAGGD